MSNISPVQSGYLKMEEVPTRFSPFFARNQNEVNTVCLDHNYAKPWNAHPDASNAQPLRMLFMEKFPRPENEFKESDDAIIDVETEEPSSCLPYDTLKARSQMVECEKHASLLCPDQSEFRDDFEEHIASMRNSWTALQNRIFAKVMRVLQADRLSRLAIQETKNEPIMRRLQVDKAARRVRQAFANTGWDMSLILWIHNLFLENLRGQLFISYLEVLQTLKAKVPSLTDKLIIGTNFKQDIMSSDTMNTLLKKSWDPVIASISQKKLKRLPENPILLMIPSAPTTISNPLSSKRHKFWYHQMAAMGKIINIVPNNLTANISIANCVENMINTVRAKILEVKGNYKDRPIVLIGWHIGAVVSCHVALMELVQAVVCLGFPTMGAGGNRWDIDDQMYGIKTPTLFIVGQHAHSLRLDMLEEMRERLRIDTGLVVVGGGDDLLRMCRAKKRSSQVTQSMVDRCIMDEIHDFLGCVLSQAPLLPSTKEPLTESFKKPRKRKQKDLGANVSSQTMGDVAKSSIKAAKALALSRAASGIYGGQVSMSTVGKIGKKISPKRKGAKFSMSSSSLSKKSSLTTEISVGEDNSDNKSMPGESCSKEAAAIASAPELSNLLQSITANQSSLSVPTSPTNSDASKMSCLISSQSLSSSITNTGISDSDKNSLKDSMETSDNSDSPNLAEQSDQVQGTSEHGSLPLSSTCSSKVIKSSSAMDLTDNTNDSQVHNESLYPSASTQALTKSTGSTVTSASQVFKAPMINSSSKQLSSSCPILMDMNAKQNPPMKTLGMSSLTNPGASIINIGNDSVFMKESPPGSNSAPGTVSIDLGEIAASNADNMLQINTNPRISLIPSKTQMYSHDSAVSSSSFETGTSSNVQIQGLPSQPQKSSANYSASYFTSGCLVRNLTDKVNLPSSYHSGSYVKSLPLQTTSGISQTTVFSLSTSNALGVGLPTTVSPATTVKSLSVVPIPSVKMSQSPGHNFPTPSSSSFSVKASQNLTVSTSSTSMTKTVRPMKTTSKSLAKLSTSSSMRALHVLPSTASDGYFSTTSKKTSVVTPASQLLSNPRPQPGMITLQLGPSKKDSSSTIVTFSKDQTGSDAKQHIFHQQIFHLRDQISPDSEDNSEKSKPVVTPNFSIKDVDQRRSSASSMSSISGGTSSVSTLLMTSTTKANLSKVLSGTKITHTNAPPVSKMAPCQGTIMLQYKSPTTISPISPSLNQESPKMVIATTTETLGQVTSLLESSPITLGDQHHRSSVTAISSADLKYQSTPKSKPISLISSTASISSKLPTTPSISSKLPTTPSISSKLPSTPSISSKLPSTASISSKLPTTSSISSKLPTTPSISSKLPSTASISSNISSSPQTVSTTKASKTSICTYTSATKPILPTVASTRTRRIKTPKQYDL